MYAFNLHSNYQEMKLLTHFQIVFARCPAPRTYLQFLNLNQIFPPIALPLT